MTSTSRREDGDRSTRSDARPRVRAITGTCAGPGRVLRLLPVCFRIPYVPDLPHRWLRGVLVTARDRGLVRGRASCPARREASHASTPGPAAAARPPDAAPCPPPGFETGTARRAGRHCADCSAHDPVRGAAPPRRRQRRPVRHRTAYVCPVADHANVTGRGAGPRGPVRRPPGTARRRPPRRDLTPTAGSWSATLRRRPCTAPGSPVSASFALLSGYRIPDATRLTRNARACPPRLQVPATPCADCCRGPPRRLRPDPPVRLASAPVRAVHQRAVPAPPGPTAGPLACGTPARILLPPLAQRNHPAAFASSTAPQPHRPPTLPSPPASTAPAPRATARARRPHHKLAAKHQATLGVPLATLKRHCPASAAYLTSARNPRLCHPARTSSVSPRRNSLDCNRAHA